MTIADMAATAVGVGVLAQIGPTETTGVEGWVSLGLKGALLVACVALWRKVEQQDREDREDRKAEREAEERRHKADEERDRLLIEVLRDLHRRDGNGKE